MNTSNKKNNSTSKSAKKKTSNPSTSNSSLVSTATTRRRKAGGGKYDAPEKAELGEYRADLVRNWREPDPEVREIFATTMEIRSWAHIDRTKVEEVEQRVNLYFVTLAERGMKPNVPGLAMALGCSRTELMRIVNGQTGKPTEVVRVLQNAWNTINSMTEDYILNTKVNPVAGIFIMKNNFGYRDQAEVIVKPSNPYGEQKDSDALAKKYLEEMPEVLDAEVVEGTDTSQDGQKEEP